MMISIALFIVSHGRRSTWIVCSHCDIVYVTL
jgi:hypothetical protein